MANSSLVSFPTKFDNLEQVRMFLYRLLEKLDVVLGYRGDSAYATEEVVTFTAETISAEVKEVSTKLVELETTVTDLREQVETVFVGTAISDSNYTAPTISATYSQAEVQAIANAIEDISDTLDSLLAVLRTAGVIS